MIGLYRVGHPRRGTYRMLWFLVAILFIDRVVVVASVRIDARVDGPSSRKPSVPLHINTHVARTAYANLDTLSF